MNVYDYVCVENVMPGDQILYQDDWVEVAKVVDETDTIMVSGYSHITGDSVTYMINIDTEVGLWSV